MSGPPEDETDLAQGVEWLKSRVVELRRKRTLEQADILNELRAGLINTLSAAKTDDNLAAVVHRVAQHRERLQAHFVHQEGSFRHDIARVMGIPVEQVSPGGFEKWLETRTGGMSANLRNSLTRTRLAIEEFERAETAENAALKPT